MSSDELSPKQANALLDILTHYEVYDEILDFRYPGALTTYGAPFQLELNTPSTSPSLQTLVSRFAINLPGLRNVSTAGFWQDGVFHIIDNFARAELSESYDKGNVGIRKTLATAISALIEYLVRGVFAGFDEPCPADLNREYDVTSAEELHAAFRDVMQQCVYGHVIDDLVEKVAQTDQLSDHTPLIKASHEYGLVNLASFMHYALIISPKGQSLLSLIDNANKLIPYAIIKQTLRIGNVASMINAMVKVVLAKVSVTSLTNWMGWTQNADEGMNLMQHIIYQVLHWDMRDLKHKAGKIEKDKDAPKKEQLHALKEYLHKSREEHEEMREKSKCELKSIVHVILVEANASVSLSEAQHKHALDYLAIQLSIRDREQIIQVLCRAQPDRLTQCVRDLVAAYEPVIRQMHNAVDLSDTVTDFEVFVKDTIKLAKISESRNREHLHLKHAESKRPLVPTVGDFVQLLKKHQYSSHKFLHQIAKNGPEITQWFHEYALQAASHFRRTSPSYGNQVNSASTNSKRKPNAGDLTKPLNEMFQTLPEKRRRQITPLLNEHAAYLSKLHKDSATRLHAVLTSPPSKHPVLQQPNQSNRSSSQPGSRSSSPAPVPMAAGTDANPGPGAFLARWQDLMDHSEITPDALEGAEVRTGGKYSVLKASRFGPAASLKTTKSRDSTAASEATASNTRDDADDEDEDDDDAFEDAFEQQHLDQLPVPEKEIPPPDVRPVVDALLPAFKELLARESFEH